MALVKRKFTCKSCEKSETFTYSQEELKALKRGEKTTIDSMGEEMKSLFLDNLCLKCKSLLS